MFTLLGALVGLVSSALPDAIAYFKEKQKNAHELAVLEMQIKAALDETQIKGEVEESKAVHEEFARRPMSYLWIEGLISSVRPVITYAFFGLYAGVKISQLILALSVTGDVVHALPAVWHETDAVMLSTIMAFWFGSRAFQRHRLGK